MLLVSMKPKHAFSLLRGHRREHILDSLRTEGKISKLVN